MKFQRLLVSGFLVVCALSAYGQQADLGSRTMPESALGVAGYVVVDGNGKVVGPVVSTNQGGPFSTVVIRVSGKLLPVAVLRAGFASGGTLYYFSTDCSGQPYGDASFFTFQASYYSPNTSTMLYGEDGPSEPAQFNSYFDGFNCFTQQYSTNYAVPMSPLLDLSQFTPPFLSRASGPHPAN